MSSCVTGDPRCFRTRIETFFDPATGERVREYWQGARLSILGLENGFKRAGFKVSSGNSGAKWELVVEFPYQPEDQVEIPATKWNLDMEGVQVPIWAHPDADKEMDVYSSRAKYVQDIQNAVKDGKPCPLDPVDFPVANYIYFELTRGFEALELKRPVLQRARTYSLSYTQQVVVNAIETVYTTSALIRVFGVDPAVAKRLPADPPTWPVGTVWAWKLRKQNQQFIPALNKTEEIQDWTFAAWSGWAYNVMFGSQAEVAKYGADKWRIAIVP